MNVGNYQATLQLNIDGIKGNIKDIQSVLNTIKVPSALKSSFDNVFKSLEKNVKQYESSLNLDLSKRINVKTVQSNLRAVQDSFKEIDTLTNKLSSKGAKLEFATIDLSKLKAANLELQKFTTAQKELEAIAAKKSKSIADLDLQSTPNLNKGIYQKQLKEIS